MVVLADRHRCFHRPDHQVINPLIMFVSIPSLELLPEANVSSYSHEMKQRQDGGTLYSCDDWRGCSL